MTTTHQRISQITIHRAHLSNLNFSINFRVYTTDPVRLQVMVSSALAAIEEDDKAAAVEASAEAR